MKAICLVPGTTQVRIADVPEPTIETPTQVKVKVLQVGICGTDREEVAGGRADAPHGEKELIIGHEMIGSVVEVGKGVQKLKAGDLVVIMVRRPCQTCPACKEGCSDMCSSGQYTERGIKGRHGFDAEFVVDEEKYMIQVPPELKAIAVLTEPTTVVEKAIDHLARLQVARLPVHTTSDEWLRGKTALVAGLGPIGLLAAMLLSLRGANVWGMDIVDEHSKRVQTLQAFGGKYLHGKEPLPKDFAADLIVEAAGISALDFELIELLAINGVYVSTGVPGDDRLLSIDGGKLMRQLVLKNQIVFGSVNAGKAHFERAVADLKAALDRWPEWIKGLITSKTPYDKWEKAFVHKDPNEIKAVLEWSA